MSKAVDDRAIEAGTEGESAVTETKSAPGWRQKVLREIKSVGLITLYFASCFALMMLLKHLVLAQHEIHFRGLSIAIVAALVVGKVVAVLEKVPLGPWVRRQPAALDVVVRTLIYTLGVFVVLLLERSFKSRHEAGGFGSALVSVVQNRDSARVWATTISVGGTLLAFNLVSILRRHLGKRGLSRLFFVTPLQDVEADPDENRQRPVDPAPWQK